MSSDFLPPDQASSEELAQRSARKAATFAHGLPSSPEAPAAARSATLPSRLAASRTLPPGFAPAEESSSAGSAGEAGEGHALCVRCGGWTATAALAKVAKNAVAPPVVGALLGLAVAAILPLRGLFVQVGGHEGVPLAFLFQALRTIGGAAVPVNMLVLGSNLAKGADLRAVPASTNLGILLMKGLGQPALMAGLVALLSRALVMDSLSPWLVAMTVSCTPTANNIMVMVELSGQNKAGMTACIFTQYLAAPFLLTLVMSLFLLGREPLVKLA
mmetsp:Transcript_49420/g.154756  ORF Transcript_49420/g.154756 Transcript_49420/m.154756 type:complete len:273 (-) Transcript_49420:267-1085(-)